MDKEVTENMCKNKSLACGRQFLEFYGWVQVEKRYPSTLLVLMVYLLSFFSLQKRKKTYLMSSKS